MSQRMTLGFTLITALAACALPSADAHAASTEGLVAPAVVAAPLPVPGRGQDFSGKLPGFSRVSRVIQAVQSQPVMVTPWIMGFFKGVGLNVSVRL